MFPPFQLTNVTTGEIILSFPELLSATGFSMIILPLVAILEAVAIAKAFGKIFYSMCFTVNTEITWDIKH